MGTGRSKSAASKEFEKDIKYMFQLFDKNGDKCITLDELGEILNTGSVKMSDEEIKQAMSDIDKNGNGKIEYKEFRSYMLKQLRKSTTKEEVNDQIHQAFKLFDIDQNGYVDRNELHEILSALGGDFDADCLDPIIAYVDKNNDGRLDYEEFKTLWSGMQDDIKEKARAACD
ncbi:hypothetical protein ACF0H5_023019 [Mactra antiquata]